MSNVSKSFRKSLAAIPEASSAECGDKAIFDRLAGSLFREAAGFRDRCSAPTCSSKKDYPPGARAWLRSIRSIPVKCELRAGTSVIVAEGRWAACVLAYRDVHSLIRSNQTAPQANEIRAHS
jgi:hypothetical protein